MTNLRGKLETILWFASRPSHWQHAISLAIRKVSRDRDTLELRKEATLWARNNATSLDKALAAIGVESAPIKFPESLRLEGTEMATQSSIKMGGPGDLDLLYSLVKLGFAKKVLETGVAYGWSSLAILAGMDTQSGCHLASVDMPYPKKNNDLFVGIVVPARFRAHWSLIRMPDRPGIKVAIAKLGGEFDLCHYDSDKSWLGRRYAYSLLWRALRPGGVFVSDDIQDNLYFKVFATQMKAPFAIIESNGKFVGMIRKPPFCSS
jgi:predicted O-methyltransferase YrrM